MLYQLTIGELQHRLIQIISHIFFIDNALIRNTSFSGSFLLFINSASINHLLKAGICLVPKPSFHIFDSLRKFINHSSRKPKVEYLSKFIFDCDIIIPPIVPCLDFAIIHPLSTNVIHLRHFTHFFELIENLGYSCIAFVGHSTSQAPQRVQKVVLYAIFFIILGKTCSLLVFLYEIK